MGINNPLVREHMNSLFGRERAHELQVDLTSMSPGERELSIVEAISQSLKEKAGQYVLPFRFKDERGTRSSHHLIFVSKNRTGYKIMKEIMATESTTLEQGVPSFEYNPASRRQPFLFEYSRPLDDLAGILLTDFAGRTLTMKQIFDRHNVGTPYLSRNYKDSLIKLETDGEIQTNPPADERRKGTFGDGVKVTFPPKTE